MGTGPSKATFVVAGVLFTFLLAVAIGIFVLLREEKRKNLGSPQAQSCREEPAADGASVTPAAIPSLTIDGAPLSPTLDLPANREPTVAETGSSSFAELTSRYQPVVRVASVDRFWPVSLNTAFKLRRAGEGTRFVPDSGKAREAALADISGTAALDDYLDYPAKIDEIHEQFCSVVRALEPAPPVPGDQRTALERLDPFQSAEVYVYLTRRAEYAGVEKPVVSLQYWFYFPFNYFPLASRLSNERQPGGPLPDPLAATKANFGLHEGDFEHVAVLFRPGPQWRRDPPLGVFMARHKVDEGRFFPLGSAGVGWQGEHPVVNSALGSHASYGGCGRQPRPHLPDDFVVCDPDPVLSFDALTTPLVDLRSVDWACFKGHLGEVPHGFRLPLKVDSGPQAPIQQMENRAICH